MRRVYACATVRAAGECERDAVVLHDSAGLCYHGSSASRARAVRRNEQIAVAPKSRRRCIPTGWQCPCCLVVYAPDVEACYCCVEDLEIAPEVATATTALQSQADADHVHASRIQPTPGIYTIQPPPFYTQRRDSASRLSMPKADLLATTNPFRNRVKELRYVDVARDCGAPRQLARSSWHSGGRHAGHPGARSALRTRCWPMSRSAPAASWC